MLTLILIEAVLALVALAVHLWPRRVGLQPRPVQIALLLMSAVPPLVCEIWGRVFGVDPRSPPQVPHPAWVVDALSAFFYASIVIGLAVIVFAKGYRIPAAIFALPQIPLTYFIGLLGVMQVTGVWL